MANISKTRVSNIFFGIVLIATVPVTAALTALGVIDYNSPLRLIFIFGTYIVAPLVALELILKKQY